MSDSCASCRFFREVERDVREPQVVDGSYTGMKATSVTHKECHRRAPLALAVRGDSQLELTSQWPDVSDTDWCGEYQASLSSLIKGAFKVKP